MTPLEESLAGIREDLSVIKHRLDEIDHEQKRLGTQLEAANEQLTLYRHIITFMRWGGAVILGIITLRFGDIHKLWGGE